MSYMYTFDVQYLYVYDELRGDTSLTYHIITSSLIYKAYMYTINVSFKKNNVYVDDKIRRDTGNDDIQGIYVYDKRVIFFKYPIYYLTVSILFYHLMVSVLFYSV